MICVTYLLLLVSLLCSSSHATAAATTSAAVRDDDKSNEHATRARRLATCQAECGSQCGTSPPSPRDAIQTFYYPWYGTPTVDNRWRHWKTSTFGDPDNDIITSPYYPRLGPYSSRQQLQQHMEWIRDAGIGVVLTSWWGVDSFEDQRVWDLLRAADAYNLKVGFYIEPYGGGYIRATPTRTAETAKNDVKHLIDTYGCHRAVYRVDGRPVMGFFAAREHLIGDMAVWKVVWDELHADSNYNPIVIAHDYLLENRIIPGSWDGGHEYGPTRAVQLKSQWIDLAQQYDAAGKIFYFTVTPGFHRHRGSNAGDQNVLDRGNGEVFEDLWEHAIEAMTYCSACRVVITSFNEWHEGTMIEPAIPFADGTGYTYEDYEGSFGGLTGDAASFSYLTANKHYSDQLLGTLSPPTQGPRAAPSSAPITAAPSSAPIGNGRSGGGVCFSGANSVVVQNRGPVAMNKLVIGDRVQVGTTSDDGDGMLFSPLLSWYHVDRLAETMYLKIHHSKGNVLEISSDHMVYLESGWPVPAKILKVGDKLSNNTIVLAIETVQRNGLFAPVTESGKIVVSGVISSNYVALFNPLPAAMQDILLHAAFGPLRLVTKYTNIKETHSDDGISNFLVHIYRFYLFLHQQHWAIQLVAAILGTPLLLSLYAACEFSPLLLGAVVAVKVYNRALRGRGGKQKAA